MSDAEKTMKNYSADIESAIKKYISDETPENLISAIRQYPYAGGKRMRPAMVLAACEAVGGRKENAVPLAVAIEYIHNFTLIHDDLMDGDSERRGMETSHVKYGLPTAVLAGDALFTKAMQIMCNLDVPPKKGKEINNVVLEAVWDLARGQQMDINNETANDISVDEYLETVRLKTSVLFAAGAAGGAIIGNAGKRTVKSIQDYAMLLGVAFQIYDDVLGICGNPKVTGKSAGNDIRRGKKTLVVCHANKKIKSKKDKETFSKIFGKTDASDSEVEEVKAILEKTGSIAFAKETALKYSKNAIKKLSCLEDSDAKKFMVSLAEFAVNRES